MDGSFENFVYDTALRSSDLVSWYQRLWPDMSSDERRTLLWPKDSTQLAAYKSLYKKISHRIGLQVTLTKGSESIAVQELSYHLKFGWVLSGSGIKAYLGKIALPDQGSLDVGHRTYFSGGTSLRGSHPIRIGAYCSIAEEVYMGSSSEDHPMHLPAMLDLQNEGRWVADGLGMDLDFHRTGAQGITIGSDVWIGRNARIFNGANLAHGCVIAERALVKGPTEAYGIYAGLPAKLKRFRFSDDIISQLLEIQWWNWPDERICRNARFFATDLTHYTGRLSDLIV